MNYNIQIVRQEENMNPNKKALISLASFFLVFVTISCSISSQIPASSSTQDTGGSATPEATTAAVPSGSLSIEQVANQTNIPPGESGTITAACPADSLMLGGGFASGEGIKITKTMPDPTGWLVSGSNKSAAALPLTAYAYCLHNDTGTVRVVSAAVPVSGAPFARCQSGEIVTGGGYADDTGSLEVYISTPIGDSTDPSNAWSVMARSSQNADEPISVYAVCLSKSSLTSTLARDAKVSYPQGTSSLSFTIACPAGAVMSSGGYEGTGGYLSRTSSTDASQWEIQVQGKYYFDGSLDHAVCLNLP
jgi:hypothetical protein